MKTRKLMMAGCVMMGTMWAGARTYAGPYPLEQLEAWLTGAKEMLATVDANIAELGRKIDAVEKEMTALEKKTSGDKAVDVDGMKKLAALRVQLSDLHHDMNNAKIERASLLEFIDWVMVQIEAWHEIHENGGPE